MGAAFWFMFAVASGFAAWGLMQVHKRQEAEAHFDKLFYWLVQNVIDELEPVEGGKE